MLHPLPSPGIRRSVEGGPSSSPPPPQKQGGPICPHCISASHWRVPSPSGCGYVMQNAQTVEGPQKRSVALNVHPEHHALPGLGTSSVRPHTDQQTDESPLHCSSPYFSSKCRYPPGDRKPPVHSFPKHRKYSPAGAPSRVKPVGDGLPASLAQRRRMSKRNGCPSTVRTGFSPARGLATNEYLSVPRPGLPTSTTQGLVAVEYRWREMPMPGTAT